MKTSYGKKYGVFTCLQNRKALANARALVGFFMDDILLCQKSFPLIFRILLWLIYALNIIQNGNFEAVFLPVISFIKNYVAENVAKSPAE